MEFRDYRLTIDNWRSEYKRLEIQLSKLEDKTCLEAQGIREHMQAVLSIIKDIEDMQRNASP